MAVNQDRREGMTLIVKTITRLTVGLILLFGLYIVFHGHLTPGGGFAGGVIIALSFTHLMLAFGRRFALERMSRALTSFFEGFGALLFLAIALGGFLGGYFFRNFLPSGTPFRLLSAGAIPFSNIAICFKVGAGLFAVFVALVLFRTDDGGEE